MLPYYTVFDHLAFEVRNGSTVVLMGEVTRPVLKDDAERVVKRLEGVEHLDNQITFSRFRRLMINSNCRFSRDLRLSRAQPLRSPGHSANPHHCGKREHNAGGCRSERE